MAERDFDRGITPEMAERFFYDQKPADDSVVYSSESSRPATQVNHERVMIIDGKRYIARDAGKATLFNKADREAESARNKQRQQG